MQIPPTHVLPRSGPAQTPALGVSVSGTMFPSASRAPGSPCLGLGSAGSTRALEGPGEGPVRRSYPLPGRSAGGGWRGLERSCALPEPLAPSRGEGPTSSHGTDEETEAQSTEVSCPGHVAGRPPAVATSPASLPHPEKHGVRQVQLSGLAVTRPGSPHCRTGMHGCRQIPASISSSRGPAELSGTCWSELSRDEAPALPSRGGAALVPARAGV